VDGRGRDGESCPPSVIPLERLPGYEPGERTAPRLHIRVPTCQATRAGMVAVPGGPFVRGGLGDLPSKEAELANIPESIVDEPAFHIDRTEVTNGAFRLFAGMDVVTGIEMPVYPRTIGFRGADAPDLPVAGLDWADCRAYCRFLGKDLPTANQWAKAARGGLTLGDGRPNPMPRRNLPWGQPVVPVPARISAGDGVEAEQATAPVGSTPGDVSPYGVLDLAGNVQEWTATPASDTPGYRITKGANAFETTADILNDMMALDNIRSEGLRVFHLGMRCALSPARTGQDGPAPPSQSSSSRGSRTR
jgi:formylglycine-generating enzyme required for sulfatase activity